MRATLQIQIIPTSQTQPVSIEVGGDGRVLCCNVFAAAAPLVWDNVALKTRHGLQNCIFSQSVSFSGELTTKMSKVCIWATWASKPRTAPIDQLLSF